MLKGNIGGELLGNRGTGSRLTLNHFTHPSEHYLDHQEEQIAPNKYYACSKTILMESTTNSTKMT